MRTAWRWFLITWLILALPLQGAVAATLRHCGPAPAVVQMNGEGGHPHHEAHRHHLHHDGVPSVQAAHHHMADGAAPPADSAGKCSVCAACCPAMAAVMPLFEAPVPLISAMRYGIPATSAPPEGLPTGLERPPRLTRV